MVQVCDPAGKICSGGGTIVDVDFGTVVACGLLAVVMEVVMMMVVVLLLVLLLPVVVRTHKALLALP